MRHTIMLITGLLLFNCVFSQTKTKEYFLEKSKKQKTVAWILLGAGAAAILTESLDANSKRGTGESLTGGVLTLAGVVCSLTSIPFFISSSKNKKRSRVVAI